MSDGYPLRLLGELMRLDIQRTPMTPGTTYRLAGVLNAGQGLIGKGEFDGTDTEYTAMNVLRADQVVMRKLTAWEGPITVVPPEFEGFVVSNEFPTFTLGDDVAPEWMRHVCRSPRLWAEMKNRVSGTVQRRKRLNPDQLLQIRLPIPPLPTQRRIAEVIDVVDHQIAVLENEAEALNSLSLATAEALTNSAESRSLGSLLDGISGGRSPQADPDPPADDEPGVLKVSAVTPFRFLPEESKTLRSGTVMPRSALVRPGDVLITRANTPQRVGAVARVPQAVRDDLYLSDKTLRLVPAADLDPDYLVIAMALGRARRHLTSAATGTSASMFNVSQDRIRQTPIPFPRIEQQRRIAAAVLAVRDSADATRIEADRLRAVHASLLTALLNRDVEPVSAEGTAA